MLAITLRRASNLALALLLGIGLLAAMPHPARAAVLADRQPTTLSVTVEQTTTPILSYVIADLTLTVAGGGRPDGEIEVVVDGVVIDTLKARSSQWIQLPTEALGPHTVVAHYRGSTTLEPSDSEEASYTVTKADTTTELNFAQETATKEDVISFDVRSTNSDAPRTKPVSVIEDGVVLDEIELSAGSNGGYGEFALTELALGEHTLRFDYPGDAHTNASHATVTFTMVEVKAVVELSIKLDREVLNYGSAVKATVGAQQTAGDPVELTGDISFYLDDELVTTRPVTDAPATVEFPVGDLGQHTIRAELEGTESYEAASTYWHYHVVKAPTRIEVDTSHPYFRSDTLQFSVRSDGPVHRGAIYIKRGADIGDIKLDVVDGKVEPMPVGFWYGLGSHHLEAEYWDFGEEGKFEPSFGTFDLIVVPKIGDTRLVTTVDREQVVVGGPPVVVTASVQVEGGAAPDGVLEFRSTSGEVLATVDVAPGQVRVELPVNDVGDSAWVRFIPSSSAQQPSEDHLGYWGVAATTATRVTAPATPVSVDGSLPVSVDVLNSPITASGRVLVTDGQPDCVWDEVYHPFELPTCTNDVAVVELDGGSGALPLQGLSAGHHELVFWYLPLGPGNNKGARTKQSRTTVPITITERSVARPDPLPAETRTRLTLARAHSTAGSKTTATADVATAAGDQVSGKVSFLVDGRVVASATLRNGRAETKIASDRVGTRSITARFTGSTAYSTSTSPARTLLVSRASATLRAAATWLPNDRLRVVATGVSAAAIAGGLEVLQRVSTTGANGRPSTRLVRVASATVRRTGTRVTVVLRTKKLRTPVGQVLLRYAGSSTVESAQRSVHVPRRG